MSDTEPQTTEQPPVPAPKASWREALTQTNITTGLAVFAVVLAAAPYVVPQVRAWQTREGLMSQPAMLQDASTALQQQANAAAMDKTREAIKARAESLKSALYANPKDPVMGNPKAPIKIVEFLDYNCGYCRAGAPQVKAFLAANPDVAIVVKEYPVISTNSRPLAAYALVAAELGKYQAVHDAFMTTKIDSEEALFGVLSGLGLDAQAMQARAASDEIQTHITDTLVLGSDLEVNGTPTFIVNGEPVNGTDIAAITAAVEKARKTS